MMIEFQDLVVLSWNIRGAINLAGKRHVRELVRKHKLSIVILVETHCSFGSIERFWQGLGYEGTVISEAQGQSGGIWVLLERGSLYSVSVVDIFHQAVTFSVQVGNRKWIGTAIYASPIPTTREALWNHLGNLRNLVTDPWMLIGDFNEILHPSEVRGGSFSPRAAMFAGMMEQCGLIDLGSIGSFFTWFRKAAGHRPISKKLDRAITDRDWRHCFEEAYVENLCRLSSDHYPLLLRLKAPILDRKARPFRFQTAWLSHKDFPPLVKNAWSEGNHVIPHSLTCVRDEAIIVNRKVFGNITRRKQALEAQLRGIQKSLEYSDSISLAILEDDLQKEYSDVLKQEEMLWFQKSRDK